MSLFKRKEKEKTAEEWILEGNSLRDMERYDEAIICYDKALELDPEDPDASELKGYLLRDGIVGLFSGGFTELWLCGAISKCLECEEPLRYEMPMRMK